MFLLGSLGKHGAPAGALAACALLALSSCAEPRTTIAPHTTLDSGAPTVTAPEAAIMTQVDASDGASMQPVDLDATAALASIPEERRALCARPADDAVRDIFCRGDASSITGLRELALRLKLTVLKPETDEASAAAVEIDPDALINTAVFLGLSTALSGHLVSPINPRAILMNGETFVAFQRGTQKVEIATRDRGDGEFNFYLVSFKQACNERAGGCVPGDLYTLQLERDWASVKLEDDEDLKNTPSDCRLCHQRSPGRPFLLMRELRGPWTHFFAPASTGEADAGYQILSGDLVSDYMQAKGGESYAGMPGRLLAHTAGGMLQFSVDSAQPLEFPAPEIEAELTASAEQGKPRRSAIWDEAYAAFKRGEHLPLPHFEHRPTDVRKQAALSDAYARYRRGELAREELPDLSDIFPDDPKIRAEIGLATEPDATPAEALIQACGACHNDVLDQTISRARFNIALGRMSRAEIDLAITRIELPSDDPSAMPPAGMRQLEPSAKARLLTYLRQTERPAADDAQLENAAKLGMAQPRPPRRRF